MVYIFEPKNYFTKLPQKFQSQYIIWGFGINKQRKQNIILPTIFFTKLFNVKQ